MLNIMLDGISVFYAYKEGILAFFIAVFGFGLFFVNLLVNWETDTRIKHLTAFGVGSVVVCVVVYGLILLSHFWPFLLEPGGYAIFLFAIFAILNEIRLGKLKPAYHIWTFILAAAFFLLLLVRLAFLKHILLPPYSDSPIHYQIVYGFLHPEASGNAKLSVATILSNYYHFGFHSLAAWLASITRFDPENSISLLGQLFLVLAPLSIFCLA